MAILTQFWSIDVALMVLSIFVAAYLYMTRNFKYWAKRGVFEIKPIPFFGNVLDCCLFRMTLGEFFGSIYKRCEDQPYVGFYICDKPALLLRDPDLIKSVLLKNFNCFMNRYVRTHKMDSIASANVFLMKAPHWRTSRNGMSPIFTTGKMKAMFSLMMDVGNNLVTHLDSLNLQGNGQAIEIKELSARYSTDVISSCAFGLRANSINDEKSQLRQCGVQMFGFATYRRCVEFLTFFLLPNVAKLLRFKFFSEEGSAFMRKVITDTVATRMETRTHRNDLIDLFVELKNSSDRNKSDDPDAFTFEGDNLVGMAATFFAAGFETSATTMAFAFYELALNPDVQLKLREEIISALEENGGEVTYSMVMNLPYLDMVFWETLRKYPSLSFLDRHATTDFEIPSTGLVIEEGTPVYIPLLGLHYDPKYFPDPEKFDPERFSKENKKELPPCVFLPFGEGPRVCVGLRFGMLQSKLGILRIILNHEVSVCAKTPIPVIFEPMATLLASKERLFVNVREIGKVSV